MSGQNYQQVRRILILSANPRGTSQLRLDEEMREIDEGLRRSKHRDRYLLYTRMAVRYRDIQRALFDYEPHIIHFSGHGEGEEGLVFENESGQRKLVNAKAIASLFKLFADQVECVVLNACYSKVQAEEIARHIDYVVGMSKAINDRAAIEFAVGFYDALGAGRSVEFAYKLGCSAIQMAGIEEHLTPILLQKSGIVDKEKKIDTSNNMNTINNSFEESKYSSSTVDELEDLKNRYERKFEILKLEEEDFFKKLRRKQLAKSKEKNIELEIQYDEEIDELKTKLVNNQKELDKQKQELNKIEMEIERRYKTTNC